MKRSNETLGKARGNYSGSNVNTSGGRAKNEWTILKKLFNEK